MSARTSSSQNGVPIAKLLAVENQVNKLTAEMEKLILISTQHGSRIKELIVASSSSVSQVDMMATVTTTRFQHMNDLKALRKNLQTKYEDMFSATGEAKFPDDADSKEVKELTSKLGELQSELSNSSFKTNMEVNKLKMELKSSKKDCEDLKRFVGVLESKLGALIEDAKASGVKTSIEMDDLPEITYQQSMPETKAPMLSEEEGIPPADPSASSAAAPGADGMALQTPAVVPYLPTGAALAPYFPFPDGSQPPYPAQGMDAQQFQLMQQMQYMQMQYQQQMYIQQQHQQQYQAFQAPQTAPHAQAGPPAQPAAYAPGMPMSDSGLSTHINTPAASPSHPQRQKFPHMAATADAALMGNVGHSDITAMFSSTDPHGARVSSAPSMFPPMMAGMPPFFPMGGFQASFPMPFSGSAPFFPGQMPAQPEGPAVDPDTLLMQSLVEPEPLSAEERHYKNQFRALKELILATMECKDLNTIEADRLDCEIRHHREERAADAIALASLTVLAAPAVPPVESGVPVSGILTAPVVSAEAPAPVVATGETLEDALTKKQKLRAFDLRFRNRDLYRNMRKVKETEKLAMTYADFCVTNMVNAMDAVSYGKFQTTLEEDNFGRFSHKEGTHSNALVQTEEVRGVHPESASKSGHRGGGGVKRNKVGGGRGAGYGDDTAEDSASGASHLRGQSRGQSRGEGSDTDAENDAADLDLLMQLVGSKHSQAPLDLGETIAPVAVLHSSTGRRQSLLQMGCVFEQDLRDPALRFLDTTFVDPIDEEEDLEDGDLEDSEFILAVSPPTTGKSRTSSFQDSPAPPLHKSLSSRPSSFGNRRSLLPVSQNPSFPSRRPSESDSPLPANLEELRHEMKNLMDRKLLKLYKALDDRWKGLDAANLSVLQKITKFQDALVSISADTQKLQMTTQLLAQKLSRVDSRVHDALAPVYMAIDAQKENVASLEGLMVDLARQLKQIEANPQGAVPTAVLTMEELMTQQRREQLPIEAILRNSQYAAGEDLAGDSYFLPGLAPAPASANMSEYELELILRQLKEYAGLYEDMMHNFQAINRRLREEDMRKSGNFNLRKPHVSGTVSVKAPASTMREIINTPLASVMDGSPLHNVGPRDLVVRLPGHGGGDQVGSDGEQAGNPESGEMSDGADGAAEPAPRSKRQSFASPHRVITDPFRISKRGGDGASPTQAHAPEASVRLGPLTRRDLLKLLENSDLSANVEIIRIKNELARLKSSMYNRESASSPNRPRGQNPPAVFPSLFTSLDNAAFSVAKTQTTSPTGSVLRTKTPSSRSGRFTEPGKPVLAGSLFPIAPAEQHASQKAVPAIAVTSGQNKSPRARARAEEQPLQFTDSLSAADAVDALPGEQGLSATSSIVMPVPHPHDPIPYPTDAGYTLSAAEDEDGLSENSLSAYEFLIHPQSRNQTAAAGAVTDGGAQLEETPVRAPSTTFGNPAAAEEAPSKSNVTITYASTPAGNNKPPEAARAARNQAAANSGGTTMWGSATNIGIGNVQTSKVTLPRASLLASPGGGGSGRVKTPAAPDEIRLGSPRSAQSTHRKTLSAKETPAGVGLASIPAAPSAGSEMRGSALSTSVKINPVSAPSPPVKVRPVVKTGASQNPRQSIARTVGATPGAPVVTSVGSGDGSNPAWTSDQVWRVDYGSVDSIGGDIASTPSVLLQGGEYVAGGVNAANAYDRSLVSGGQGVAFVRAGGMNGSVDSIPQNSSVHLGENAFD